MGCDFCLLDILLWWPWVNFISDYFFLQLLTVYVLFSYIYIANYFYLILYLFFFILFFGLFLGLHQLDLFLGFFWVIELTVVFISLILVFYINNKPSTSSNFLLNSVYKYSILFISIMLVLPINYLNLSESSYFNLNSTLLWENYYEALNFFFKNDFYSLFYSYYSCNSVSFILIGFLLFIGSLVCVNLNIRNKSSKKNNLNFFLKTFSFFKDYLNFFFLRKQDLTLQGYVQPSSKFVRKKNGAKKLNINTSK